MDSLAAIKTYAGDKYPVFLKHHLDDTLEYTIVGWSSHQYQQMTFILTTMGYSAFLATFRGKCEWRQKNHCQHKIYIS